MPTYDYECKECKNIFEISLGISDLDKVNPKCPKCKSECKRLVSGGTGIIFKGSGFYCNDYPKPNAVCDNCKKSEEVDKGEVKDDKP